MIKITGNCNIFLKKEIDQGSSTLSKCLRQLWWSIGKEYLGLRMLKGVTYLYKKLHYRCLAWRHRKLVIRKSFTVLEFQEIRISTLIEAAFQKCSQEKVFWKYAANLQEYTQAVEWFQ